MLPFSVLIWLIFEGYNLVLRNWAYGGVPAETWLRWPGYFVAFATVLPGIFITSDLFEYIVFRPKKGAPFASEKEALSGFASGVRSPLWMTLGFCLSAAPLLWPRYFFPAVWLGPIFLLDPLLPRFGIKNLRIGNAEGNRSRILSLMAGGFACGLLWEFWNYWAGSHWVYSVPLFGGWKIFQMPVLGFFGFPPFALECWILYHLLSQWQRRRQAGYARWVPWFAIGIFCIVMFRAIDARTVLRFVE